MRQILCLSHTPWQARPNRTQQLLARMSDVQVLFIEPPAPRSESKPEQDRRMRSHITVCTLPCSLPTGPARTFMQRRSLNRAAAFIRDAMARHHFRNPILWCTAPNQAGLLGYIPARGIVYDCHCEWSEDFVDLESDLANQADVVFAASPGLVQRLSPCSENIALLPNGVNPLMFERGEFAPPDWLSPLSGQTVLGHLGDLTGQVDLIPLLNAATAHSDWKFLMMGRYSKSVRDTLSRYQNIILTGAISAAEVPDYFSLCSMFFDPARQDRAGCDIVPSHIYEYMATGKPIVTLLSPDSPDLHPELIYTAYDSAGFLRRCKNAMKEDSALRSARKQFAAQSSWSNRAGEIIHILESTGLF